MPKNPPPPACPKCSKPMHFIVVKTGGRRFRCINCDGVDPIRMCDIQSWIKSEQPPRLQ
jgi:hypothetical protein